MAFGTFTRILAVASLATCAAGAVAAQQSLELVGRPTPGGINFQPPSTEVARNIYGLDFLLIVITGLIVLFVTGLLIWCIVRFNARRNPTPARFTHNAPLEIGWTIGPILILFLIGAYSLPVLFHEQEIPEADLVIKSTGYQWYWGYEYVGEDVAFDSFMIGAGDNRLTPDVEAELVAAGYSADEFLLATDTAVVVPIGKTVVMQLTGADVIHGWYVPSLGVQLSAVPGRLSQTWFKAEREGVFFGQCSALCGQAHAYMPIVVKVVSEAAYAEWLAKAKTGDVLLTAVPAATALAQAD